MFFREKVPEMSPAELVAAVEAGEPWQVLDVRAPERVAAGTVDLVPAGRFRNVPGSRALAVRDSAGWELDPGLPVAVVCTRGNDSRVVATHLRALGFEAVSLAGGILRWMATVIARPLAPPAASGLDRLVQLDRIGKGALAYLLASGGEALVVDPPRHLDVVLGLLEESGARLTAVLDTHAHADYLSGGPALAECAGAPYLLHPRDAVSPYDGRSAALDFQPLAAGEPLRLGRATLVVEETPGHTAGSVSLRLGEALALTGDFLFLDSIGRPDLGGRAAEWTRDLWRSLERSREWPDCMRVLPGHYASDAERAADRTVGAPLGEVRRRNPAFALEDFAALARWVEERSGSAPDAYVWIKTANLGLERLSPDEADALEAGRNQCALG